MSVPVLIFHSGPLAGKARKIKEDEVILGRSSSCSVSISDASMSRKHARIYKEGDHYFLEDMGSQNGIKVNGEKIPSIQLIQGIKFKLGNIEIEYFVDQMAPSTANPKGVTIDQGASAPDVFQDEFGLDKSDPNQIKKQKQYNNKRVTNLVILVSIIVGVVMLSFMLNQFLNSKPIIVQTFMVEMKTNESRLVDLNFIPSQFLGHHKRLKSFIIPDHWVMVPEFTTLKFGKDILIKRNKRVGTREINMNITRILKVSTKSRTGKGLIYFYEIKSENEKVLRAKIFVSVSLPERTNIQDSFLDTNLDQKIQSAKEYLAQYHELKNTNKNKEAWQRLKDGISIFDNETKPEIYFKMTEELNIFNKNIEKEVKGLEKQFDLHFDENEEARKFAQKIIKIIPDDKNLKKQQYIIFNLRKIALENR